MVVLCSHKRAWVLCKLNSASSRWCVPGRAGYPTCRWPTPFPYSTVPCRATAWWRTRRRRWPGPSGEVLLLLLMPLAWKPLLRSGELERHGAERPHGAWAAGTNG